MSKEYTDRWDKPVVNPPVYYKVLSTGINKCNSCGYIISGAYDTYPELCDSCYNLDEDHG